MLPNQTVYNLAKRTWQYCQQSSTLQGLLCNTTHGFERVFSGISQAIFDAFIHDRLSQTLTNGRVNKNPRSICRTYDNDGLCTSCANYISNNLKNGESTDMANFAAKCDKKGRSSQFAGTDSSNGVIYICVSNRSGGCSDTNAPC